MLSHLQCNHLVFSHMHKLVDFTLKIKSIAISLFIKKIYVIYVISLLWLVTLTGFLSSYRCSIPLIICALYHNSSLCFCSTLSSMWHVSKNEQCCAASAKQYKSNFTSGYLFIFFLIIEPQWLYSVS